MELTGKYRNTVKDPIDGAKLTTRAHPDGYPTREEHSRGPYLDKDRREAASEILFARSEFLTLPKDNERYTVIIDWIANGQAVLRFEERHRNDDKSWDVWITYLDIRGYVPTDTEFSEMMGSGSGSSVMGPRGMRL